MNERRGTVMKKTTFAITSSTVLAALIFVCAISGCKNFMQLAGFKDTIQTEVDVANASQITITLNSVKSTGDTYLGGTKLSGTSVQKQNVSFNVSFEENSGYG